MPKVLRLARSGEGCDLDEARLCLLLSRLGAGITFNSQTVVGINQADTAIWLMNIFRYELAIVELVGVWSGLIMALLQNPNRPLTVRIIRATTGDALYEEIFLDERGQIRSRPF